MNVVIRIYYQVQIPSAEDLIKAIQNTTGLPVYYEKREVKYISSHEEMHVSVFQSGECYIVNKYDADLDYLFVSTLFCLKRLGGIYYDELPDWAGEKWDQVKENFDKNGFPIY